MDAVESKREAEADLVEDPARWRVVSKKADIPPEALQSLAALLIGARDRERQPPSAPPPGPSAATQQTQPESAGDAARAENAARLTDLALTVPRGMVE